MSREEKGKATSIESKSTFHNFIIIIIVMFFFYLALTLDSHFFYFVYAHQVQNEYVQTLQEAPVHIGDFTLFYRTASLRMKIDKHQYHNGKSFTLKCEATFGHFTHLTRAKSARVFIVSTDDLTNQKLVNSKSAATGK